MLPLRSPQFAALLAIAALSLSACNTPSDRPQRIEAAVHMADPALLETWRDLIKPGEDERRWESIDWRSSAWDAILEARALDRPLLVWSMNGHPLGFT